VSVLKTVSFEPDYTNILKVLHNVKTPRLCLYEHIVDPVFISKYLDKGCQLQGNKDSDYEAYHRTIAEFWQKASYDAISYEGWICDILPGHGAIKGGMKGPIQNREDFEKYPFDEVPRIFWECYTPHLEALKKTMPAGMKAYGGCGNGIFEISEDLVGYEYLSVMQYLDPELFRDLYSRIGDLMVELWSEMIAKYSDIFVFFRMGDDLGFKTSTLLEPDTFRNFIFPQYKRVINLIHKQGKKFLLHSCGNIFPLMDDLIELGIDAKHSNEDQIAPFDKWIDLYGDRIGLMGGIDVNTLCLGSYEEVYEKVLEDATRFRNSAKGWALGSGNSIADYVPVEGYQAMIDAARELRRQELLHMK
jgi:uroporphyrinogen-III decarboxylase